jgi:hypothetical protein
MGINTQIQNRNFLSPTGFKFTLKRSSKVAFFCNEANIPELNLGVALQPTYLKDIDTPGDKIIFSDLRLRFLVDENLTNYMEIQNWIRGLGYPEKLSQYAELEAQDSYGERYSQTASNVYSDGTLQVLNSNSIANFQVVFKDLFPYSLSTLTFDATTTDIQYFTADVSFKYTVYDITDLEGNPLYGY